MDDHTETYSYVRLNFKTDNNVQNMLSKNQTNIITTFGLEFQYTKLSGWCNQIVHGCLVAHLGLLVRGQQL